MKLYKYEDGVKIAKYPLLCLYIERMQESWQGKLFGIVLPLYAVICTTLILTSPTEEYKGAYLIIQVISSVCFLTSYLLLVIRDCKDMNKKLTDLESKFKRLK